MLRQYGTARPSFAHPKSKSSKRVVLVAATGAVATGSLLAFTDDIKQNYETVERVGRVASALLICINE